MTRFTLLVHSFTVLLIRALCTFGFACLRLYSSECTSRIAIHRTRFLLLSCWHSAFYVLLFRYSLFEPFAIPPTNIMVEYLQ